MTKQKSAGYFYLLKWMLNQLPNRKYHLFWLLFICMLVSALLETFALGAIAFFASAISDPEIVMESKYFNVIKQYISPKQAITYQHLIIGSGVLLIVLVVFKNMVKGVVTYLIPRFSVGIEAFFGQMLLGGFLNLPYEWHLSKNSADLINSVQWRYYLGRGIILPTLKLANDFLMVSVMLISLLVVQPLVSLGVFFTLGSVASFIYFNQRNRLDKLATKSKDHSLLINKETTMAIQGVKDVKIAKMENAFIRNFVKNEHSFAKIHALQQFFIGFPVFVLETVGFIMLAVSIWAMMFFSNASTAEITGTITLLAVTGWRALPAVNQILSSLTGIRVALPFIQNQIEYIHQIEKGIIFNKSNIKSIQQENVFCNRFSFNNVSFKYHESEINILHDISFEVKKGKTVGIIGSSGAGKSTLVDIITGIHTPLDGEICVDGNHLDHNLLPHWLGLIGYVPQSPYIFDGSMAENIAFGDRGGEIDRERVLECCEMASMTDFIKDLPSGIDTPIGERGVKISGGQKQRVAIARALYNHPEIMIFDEATSSLDTKSEKAIQKTIYSFKGKQTLIIIAHRLSTVVDCDYLIWLEKGHIKMIGPPKDVLDEYKEKNNSLVN